MDTSESNNHEKKGIKLNQISSKKDELISLPKEQVAILFALQGKIILNSKSGRTVIEQGGGFMLKQSSNFKISVGRENFDGIICLLNTSSISRILSTMPMPPAHPKAIELSDELVIPPSENLQLFIQTLRLYIPHSHNEAQDWRSISESKLCELFWLLNHSDISDQFQHFIYCIQKPERYIFDWILERYFKENLTLNELADIAGYSISTFKRKFENMYGATPGKWIQNRRLQEAQFLLQITDKTVSEICYEVGFENPSHFIQAFKAKFGTTPKRMQFNQRAA